MGQEDREAKQAAQAALEQVRGDLDAARAQQRRSDDAATEARAALDRARADKAAMERRAAAAESTLEVRHW
jgi:hypothetical protein